MLAISLRRVGNLMIDVILQHQTVADIEETSKGEVVEKWKTFVLNSEDKGKKVTKKIVFSPDLMGQEMSKEDMRMRELELLKREGGIKSDTRIIEVNPEAWRKLKYQMIIDVQDLLPKNEIFDKALKQEAYDRLIANPLVDAEAVTRDFLIEPYANGEVEKYIRKTPVQSQQTIQAPRPRTDLIQQLTGGQRAGAL